MDYHWPKNLKPQAGLSLVEVLVALGMATMVYFAASKVWVIERKSAAMVDAQRELYLLMDMARLATSNRKNIGYLQTADSGFDLCIREGQCRRPRRFHPVPLFIQDPGAGARPITGRYQTNGQPCPNSNASCPVELKAAYKPICGTPCQDPLVFNFRIELLVDKEVVFSTLSKYAKKQNLSAEGGGRSSLCPTDDNGRPKFLSTLRDGNEQCVGIRPQDDKTIRNLVKTDCKQEELASGLPQIIVGVQQMGAGFQVMCEPARFQP